MSAQPPDESSLSKRERQKQRRERKVAQERAAARAARRRRLVAATGIVVVAVAVLGYFVFDFVAQRRAENAAIAEAAGRLDELGCTPINEQPDLGQGHLANLQANPPENLYPSRPASSGQHIGGFSGGPGWIISGVYDEQIDERLLVHNLEHGYVNFYYAPDAPQDQVEQLKAFAAEQIDGRYPKIIVAPFGQQFSEEANFATVAWGLRQFCDEFEEGVALAFLDRAHGLSGDAPENNLAPHLNAPNEGIDPEAEEGPLLLPPLGEPEDEVDTQATMPEGAIDPTEIEPTTTEPPTTEPAVTEPAGATDPAATASP